MTLKTIPIRVNLVTPDGSPAASAALLAELTAYEVDDLIVIPNKLSATTDATGSALLRLWPNARGINGSQYRVAAVKGGVLLLNVLISVPDGLDTVEVPLQSIITTAPYPAVSESAQALIAAQAAAADAAQQAVLASQSAAAAEASAMAASTDADSFATSLAIVATNVVTTQTMFADYIATHP